MYNIIHNNNHCLSKYFLDILTLEVITCGQQVQKLLSANQSEHPINVI